MVNSLSSSTAALTDVLLEGSRHLHGMGAPWEEILPVLRQRGIVPTASVRQMLLETEDLGWCVELRRGSRLRPWIPNC